MYLLLLTLSSEVLALNNDGFSWYTVSFFASLTGQIVPLGVIYRKGV